MICSFKNAILYTCTIQSILYQVTSTFLPMRLSYPHRLMGWDGQRDLAQVFKRNAWASNATSLFLVSSLLLSLLLFSLSLNLVKPSVLQNGLELWPRTHRPSEELPGLTFADTIIDHEGPSRLSKLRGTKLPDRIHYHLGNLAGYCGRNKKTIREMV